MVSRQSMGGAGQAEDRRGTEGTGLHLFDSSLGGVELGGLGRGHVEGLSLAF